MGCDVIDLGNGSTAMACSRGRRRPKCQEPGCNRPCDVECDFPLRGEKAGKTCDRKCCRGHSKRVGPNRDHCLPHAKEPAGG
jgi:hypothetical protein